MLIEKLLPPVASSLAQALDLRAARQEVLADNIANVDTPGYRRKDVSFAPVLEQAQTQLVMYSVPQHAGHIPLQSSGAAVAVQEDDRPGLRNDGNNVNVDEEMALLSKNTGEYLALSELLNRSYDGVATAIRETVR